MYVFLPVGTVKRYDAKSRQHIAIETAQVNGEGIGMGSGAIKRVYATVAAESVQGSARIKGVCRQNILATQQRKAIAGHDQVQKALLFADGAIAISSLMFVNDRPKADSTTVTCLLYTSDAADE